MALPSRGTPEHDALMRALFGRLMQDTTIDGHFTMLPSEACSLIGSLLQVDPVEVLLAFGKDRNPDAALFSVTS